MTVASTGPYTDNVHLASTPHHSIFTRRMLFLTPNQQCQCTEEWRQRQTKYWEINTRTHARTHIHTHAHPFNDHFPGLARWASTRKVKPIWNLLKQETVSGSGISWAVCKSAPHSKQITMPAPHHSVFYRPDALPAAQPTASKHWRHKLRDQTDNKTHWNKWIKLKRQITPHVT